MSESIERDTVEIETPIGKAKIKLKAWLTGGEKLKLSKVDRNDFEASARASIELVVVETPADVIFDMHGKDFDFILEEISNVIQGSSYGPKAQPSDSNTQS